MLPASEPSLANEVDALHWRSAHELAAGIRAREVSAVEVVTAFLERIGEVNPALNAIVTLTPDEALHAAAMADRRAARGGPLGPLHGLPIALKDLMDVAGMRTTYGSPIYAEHVPTADSVLAERLRGAGAIIIGKTNTAEFGTGALTFNPVFGATRNPYDLSRAAGGSSGGAAAAVAAGMLPFADGSDSGGSIRYPASFCNLVGLFPSPGRVPSGRGGDGWSPHGLLGPIARTARDAGLLLSGIAGRDDRSPIALEDNPAVFAALDPTDLRGVRIAWSRTADGLPIDSDTLGVLDKAREMLVELGCVVDELEPDLSGADECWETLEMLGFLAYRGSDVSVHRDLVRRDVADNVEIGRALTATEIVRAQAVRTEIYRRTVRLLSDYDLLALPAAPVPAPPIEAEWVHEIAGVRFERYFGWQRCATRVTVTAHPALSVPAGFTADGLPIGLQLVGRHRGELALLRQAAAFEQATGLTRRRPRLPPS